jgi:sugar lactone lactonase YvrE
MQRLKGLAYVLGFFAAVLVLLAISVRLLLGGGRRLEDRTSAPILPPSALEVVVDLDYPPGNIAVSADGRLFFTLHPDGNPPAKVLELIDGQPKPYPNAEFQNSAAGTLHFQSPLALRVDQQGRLWVLDYALYGRGQPRLLGFDLRTNAIVHQVDFPPEVAGFLSMLNDFQVDAAGEKIYIAETSPILQRPALIVYDTVHKTSRRLLQGHPSVATEDYVIQAPDRDMIVFGLYTMRIAVDSIALDHRDEWLYYGAVTGSHLFRVRTRDLNDESLSPAELGKRVEDFAPKTLSDGLTMDVDDNIYLSDMEHSAIVRLGQDRRLTTLVKDRRLRWPDGFSFGPGGWLYVTCSSLQNVLFVGSDEVRKHAPYQIFRFQPGVAGVPGH